MKSTIGKCRSTNMPKNLKILTEPVSEYNSKLTVSQVSLTLNYNNSFCLFQVL